MADFAGNKGVELVHHAWMDGTIIPGLRMDLAKRALEMEATHILWIDCDMKFKPENVRKLMSRDKDIVAANYYRRLPPHEPTAIGLDGKYCRPKVGLEEVIYCGMGLMLTKTSVFKDVEQPWFLTPYSEDIDDYIGEDVWFCRYMRDHDKRIFVDHDASAGVGHVAKTVLTMEAGAPALQLVEGSNGSSKLQ